MNIYRNDLTKDLCSIMLYSAAKFGYLKIIQTLVRDYHCNPAAGGNYVFLKAARNGHLAVVKYLIEEVEEKYGVDPAAGDNYAIEL